MEYDDLPIFWKFRRHVRHASRKYRTARVEIRKFIGLPRQLPDFLVIGAQKCGSSNLYFNICSHPNVRPALKKEIYYFSSRKYHRGQDWYRAHFPTNLYMDFYQRFSQRKLLTGEATPDYLYYPHTPRRVRETLPGVRLIAVLRNPVDRAWSHYMHNIGAKIEVKPFYETVREEMEIFEEEITKAEQCEEYTSPWLTSYSLLSRGIYVDQIQRWRKFFPVDQMMIIKAEDFFENTGAVFQEVLDFLGLQSWIPRRWDQSLFKYRKYPRLDASIREELVTFFRPHNKKLCEYLKKDFGWD